MNKNDLVIVEITGMTHDGAGVGRAGGMAVFVPNTAAGDTAEVRIVKVGSRFCYGRLERLLSPSPDREENTCPVYPRCGGCTFRHLSYQAELRVKRERVRDALVRIGGFSEPPVEEMLPSDAVCHYRNKALIPIGRGKEGAELGFYAARSHQIVPFESCLIQGDTANRVAQVVRRWIDQYHISIFDGTQGLLRHLYVRTATDGAYLAALVANGKKLPHWEALLEALQREVPGLRSLVLNVNTGRNNVVLGDRCICLYGDGVLEDTLCGLRFRLSLLSFYQVNAPQAERLYRLIGDLAALDGTQTVLDLYCGTGTIGLSLAGRAKAVVGAEIIPQAVEDARLNAARNGIENARFFCADAREAAKRFLAEELSPQVIVVDPPRKGCDGETLEAIVRMAPEKLIYMSCDCETMARDAKYLAGQGYVLRRCIPADLFPRTPHVECVALMLKEK